MATRLVSLIREEFNAELQVRVLFESPTVAELSECFKALSDAFVLPPVVPTERTVDIPLSYSQQRLWFIDRLEEGSSAYNAPGKFMLQGKFNEKASV